MTAYNWEADPQRLAFQAARYKFVAKMFEGKARVLEVGCADGQGARIVRQHVGSVVAVDSDKASINEARRLMSARWPIDFIVHDIVEAGPLGRTPESSNEQRATSHPFDGVYCLDLFEHIQPCHEDTFLAHLRASAPVCIIGTPSLESQRYASEISLREHVNCKSGSDLRRVMLEHWSQVFLFGMNDETLHTGFSPMAHYLLAVAVA